MNYGGSNKNEASMWYDVKTLKMDGEYDFGIFSIHKGRTINQRRIQEKLGFREGQYIIF